MHHVYFTNTRAGIFPGILLAVMSLVNSSLPANSQSTSLLGEDSAKTLKAKPVHKTSFAFKASELFLAGGTAFDMTTTVRSMGHPTAAYRSDGRFLTHYYVKETGWAGFLGDRDPYTAVAANVVLSVGVDCLSRRLYARGGRWHIAAFGVNILKGTLSSIAAGNNIRSNERIDDQVRFATGYSKGQIVWSR